MYSGTFADCTGLKGAIPNGLFGALNGSPVNSMFWITFRGDVGLTSIPPDLFAGISGDLPTGSDAFANMFWGCSGLTGPSGRIDGRYLYEIWPDANNGQLGLMSAGAINSSDYAEIPAAWK